MKGHCSIAQTAWRQQQPTSKGTSCKRFPQLHHLELNFTLEIRGSTQNLSRKMDKKYLTMAILSNLRIGVQIKAIAKKMTEKERERCQSSPSCSK